jgi:hypothetical protein
VKRRILNLDIADCIEAAHYLKQTTASFIPTFLQEKEVLHSGGTRVGRNVPFSTKPTQLYDN